MTNITPAQATKAAPRTKARGVRSTTLADIADKLAPPATPDMPVAQPATKQSQFIALLSRETGASIAELVVALGWQPHTTRAALTGLRKKGQEIAKTKVGEETRYAIVAVAA